MTNFPNNLRHLRESAGISQEYLAEELGVSRQAVTSWECAHAEPNICMLVKIAKYFRVSLDELVEKNKDPYITIHLNADYGTDPEKLKRLKAGWTPGYYTQTPENNS